MRKPLISANWKMNLNHFEALQFIQKLAYLVGKDELEAVDVSIHPPFTDIRTVQNGIISDKLQFIVGAQNCHWEDRGAFTGEVSAAFLAKLDVRYVIVGHSERREAQGETNSVVRGKAEAALAAGLAVIICVGETDEVRVAGHAVERVSAQLDASLPRSFSPGARFSIAYEPIWAIGTGKVPSTADIGEMHAALRERLQAAYGEAGDTIRILYGGSVKASNAAEIFAVADVDGALVGGASLKAVDFLPIVEAAR